MGLPTRKIVTYDKNIKDLSDTPNKDGLTAADLKAFFDGRTDKEVKDSINGIVDDLVSTTDGVSGADNIGATPLKVGGATKVQGQLEEISTTLDEHAENNEHVKAQVGAPTGQAIGALWFQDLGGI